MEGLDDSLVEKRGPTFMIARNRRPEVIAEFLPENRLEHLHQRPGVVLEHGQHPLAIPDNQIRVAVAVQVHERRRAARADVDLNSTKSGTC